MTLKERYEACCDEYLQKFAEKQEIEFDYWVGDIVGEVASFLDQYFFGINEIIYDIEQDCKAGLILEWQDDNVEFGEDTGYCINYRSYAKGLRYSDIKKE